jgi:hypothetical protein
MIIDIYSQITLMQGRFQRSVNISRQVEKSVSPIQVGKECRLKVGDLFSTVPGVCQTLFYVALKITK